MIHELDIFQKFYCSFTSGKGYHVETQNAANRTIKSLCGENYFETKSFEIMQQRFEENFPERSSPTKRPYGKMSGSSIMKEQQ